MEVDKHKIPQFDELIKPILLALTQLGGSASNKEIIKKVIEILEIPEEIKNISHNELDSRTELEYRAAWARTYLKKAGYIDNPKRSFWTLKKNIDLNQVNAQKIVELVRNEVSLVTEKLMQQEISRIEAAQAFEKYVLETLEDYLRFQNKSYEILNNKNIKTDMYIPTGIADENKPLFIEIKYGEPFNINVKIENFCTDATDWIDFKNSHLLFIVNQEIKNKNNFIQILKDSYNIDVSIWDINEFTEKIPTFPKNLEYLSNPRASIVEDVIKEKNEEKLLKENEEKLQSLKDAYKSERLVLFLGAGVSIDAGIPLWKELINKLLLRMINLKIQDDLEDSDEKEFKGNIFTEEDIKKINDIALDNKEETPLMQMRYIRAALDKDKYYEAVHEELYAKNINVNTKLLQAIANISTPRRQHKGLESIVTYNFDDLLEQSLSQKNIDYNVIQSDSKMPVSDKLNIYHVHGYLTQKDSKEERAELIFSEEDYHRVYGDAYCWSNMAQVKAFQDNICLFVGCSLTDPNLRRLLDNAMRHPEETRHFAILKRKKFQLNNNKEATDAVKWYQELDDGIRNQIFKSFGINIIWVNDYNEIPVILNNLLSAD